MVTDETNIFCLFISIFRFPVICFILLACITWQLSASRTLPNNNLNPSFKKRLPIFIHITSFRSTKSGGSGKRNAILFVMVYPRHYLLYTFTTDTAYTKTQMQSANKRFFISTISRMIKQSNNKTQRNNNRKANEKSPSKWEKTIRGEKNQLKKLTKHWKKLTKQRGEGRAISGNGARFRNKSNNPAPEAKRGELK